MYTRMTICFLDALSVSHKDQDLLHHKIRTHPHTRTHPKSYSKFMNERQILLNFTQNMPQKSLYWLNIIMCTSADVHNINFRTNHTVSKSAVST